MFGPDDQNHCRLSCCLHTVLRCAYCMRLLLIQATSGGKGALKVTIADIAERSNGELMLLL